MNMELYGVYCGDNGYKLMRDGEVIHKRLRQFRKAVWKTHKGAQRAADALNATVNTSLDNLASLTT